MIGFQSENNSPLYRKPYIKTLYPPQNDTNHHISSHISSFCKKYPSKNGLPKLTRVPRVSPPFFVVGDTSTSNLSTFQPWGQGAFGSVYEARDVKSMQMVVCKVQWKNQKKPPTNDPTKPTTEPTTQGKTELNQVLFDGLGYVEGYETKNVEDKGLLSG